ncbi:MAG TPA: MoaD/ThiS family protein [Candidatus Acidoferrum sp.]|nr:MoaD/ThiS family protein [Candidatus Acidoferrum sp.]
MKIYLYATLRLAAGRSAIETTVGEPRDLVGLLSEVAQPLGQKFQTTLFDGENSLAPDVVVCLNERMLERGERVTVSNSDEVSLLMPLAGG